jgi:hypothetical protein
MADQQVQTGFTATIEARFYADGVLTDDGAPTVGITKADGSVLVPAGTATTSGGAGVRRYALAAQPEVNRLKATWTGATQTVVTWIEVVGALLFTLAAAKAFDGGAIMEASNTPAVTDQDILDARAQITDDFATILTFSPVPRFCREVLNGEGDPTVLLAEHKAHRVIAASIDGTALSADELADLHVESRVLTRKTLGAWPRGVGNVTVEYVHGDQRVDGSTARAALIVAKSQLVRSDVTDRATSLAGPEGGTTFLSTAGRPVGGDVQWYGLPLVDSVLNRRRW